MSHGADEYGREHDLVEASAPSGGPPGGVANGSSRVALGLLSAVAVLAAATFAVVALTAADGADSPEAAVQGLFDALADEDAMGVMESLPPGERSVLLDPLVDTVGEMQRLGVLDSFDLDDVPGADIEVDGLTLEATALGEGVTKVRITGGTISGTVIPDDVPVGPKAHELAEREGDGIAIEAESGTESLTDLELVAIEEGGGWHVSLFYSVAEAIRGDDHPLPQFGASRISPIGSDTPEGAVRGFVEAGLDLDLGTAVGYLPPDEMRVAYDYVPLFLDEVDESADELRADGFTASIDRLDLSASGSGDRRQVAVTGLDVTAGTPETSTNYRWDGSCTVLEMTYQEHLYRATAEYGFEYESGYEYGYEHEGVEDGWDPGAGAEPDDVAAVEPDAQETRTVVDRMEVCAGGSVSYTQDGEDMDLEMYPEMSVLPFGTGASLGQTITVVEHGGRWYVSPVQTMFDSMLAALRGIEEGDVDDVFDSWTGWFGTSASYEYADTGSTIYSPTTTHLPTDDPFAVCYGIYDDLDLDVDDADEVEEMEEVAARVEAADQAFEECLQDIGNGSDEVEVESIDQTHPDAVEPDRGASDAPVTTRVEAPADRGGASGSGGGPSANDIDAVEDPVGSSTQTDG